MRATVGTLVNASRHRLEEVLPLKTPYSVFIDVCNLCNFKCKFCAPQTAVSNRRFKKQVMDEETFERIINQLKQFPEPIKMIRLAANGEPLLNPYFPEMVRMIKNSKMANWVETVTNGSLLTPSLSLAIVNAGLDRIRISIEALDLAGYKKMGCDLKDWNSFIENIKFLYEHKGRLEIYIKTVDATVNTKWQEKRFYDLFGDMCDKISVERVIPHWPGFKELDNHFKINNEYGLHGGGY